MQRLFLEMGLSPTEVEAYQFLLERNTATPTEVARAIRQSRGRIYETLRQLVALGFAREQPTRPIKYAAVPLAQAVSMAAARITQQTRAVRQMQTWMQKAGSAPPAVTTPIASPSSVAVLTGRRACSAELERLISQSREWLLLAGGAALAARFQAHSPLREALAGAQNRGVQTRVLHAAEAERVHDLSILLFNDAGRVEVQPRDLDDSLLLVASESATLEILVQPSGDDPNKGDDLGVRILSPVHAAAVRTRLQATARPSG